jgi:hypothetical protein
MAESISKYDNLGLSDKTLSGLSLTSDDQHLLKRLFDRQDEFIEDYFAEKFKGVEEKYDKVLELIYEQNKNINNIQKLLTLIQKEIIIQKGRLDLIEGRVALIERQIEIIFHDQNGNTKKHDT